jgi:hypothetical protein
MWKLLLNFLPQADILYVVMFLSAAGVGGYYLHKYHAAINYETTVKAESAATLAAARKTIIDNDTDYKAKLAAEKITHANDTLAALQQHNDDVARLRAAAARHGYAPLGGPAAPAAVAASGSSSEASLSGLPEQAIVCQRLSDALEHDDGILTSERAERDALTGK